MISIIDYGMGNIHSVRKAVESLGEKARITNKAAQILSADKIILPGVGAFSDAMAELKRRGLDQAIGEFIEKGGVFLGICLGMQLLMEKSQEAPRVKGLAVVQGQVKRFKDSPLLKVPHMGWNQLRIENKKCPLFKGIADGSYVYFCHSYYADPGDRRAIAASTDYSKKFASVAWRDNLFAVQFHPEKSQDTGMRILKNFVRL
jgi:glutamine amidotransferase